jgi:hypothetical protein
MRSTLSLLPTVRTSAISVATTKQPSDKLYNISYLLKPMGDERTLKMTSLVPTNNVPSISTFHQQQTVINAPMYELKTTASQFPLNRLKKKEKKLDMYQSNKKSNRKQQKFSKYLFLFVNMLDIRMNFNLDQKQMESINSIVQLIALLIVRSLSSVS